MPPWPADPHYRSFEGQKVLTEEEIKILKQWQENGCPEGDVKNKINIPAFPEGSAIGKPDLVLKLEEPYKIKGENNDKFLLMKFPYELDRDTFIRCIEFVAGNSG